MPRGIKNDPKADQTTKDIAKRGRSTSRSLRATVANVNKIKNPNESDDSSPDREVIFAKRAKIKQSGSHAKKCINFGNASNSENNNATVSADRRVISDRQFNIKMNSKAKVDPSESQVKRVTPVLDAENDLVDDVCHDDVFGDGVHLSIDDGTLPRQNDESGSSEDLEGTVVIPQGMDELCEEDRIMANPRFQSIIDRAVERRLDKVMKERNSMGGEHGRRPVTHTMTSADGAAGMERQVRRSSPVINTTGGNAIKSPSDTTIYAPALNRHSAKHIVLPVSQNMTEAANFQFVDELARSTVTRNALNQGVGNEHSMVLTPEVYNNQQDVRQPEIVVNSNLLIPNQVSDFVERIRYNVEEPQPGTSQQQNKRSADNMEEEVAKQRAQSTVVGAEKFKANVQVPSGMLVNRGEPMLNTMPLTNFNNVVPPPGGNERGPMGKCSANDGCYS